MLRIRSVGPSALIVAVPPASPMATAPASTQARPVEPDGTLPDTRSRTTRGPGPENGH
ncbi:hypothetical protein ACWCP6_00920 [Streptomyces sp. NPDC002004]